MRRLRLLVALFAALCGTAGGGRAAAADPVGSAPAVACAECGMSARIDGAFTARLVAGGATRHFCDIGDLVAFIGRTQPQAYVASVRDIRSGEWLDAGAACFVIDKNAYRSPMGWGVAAFKDCAAAPAPALDFEALRKALR